MDLPEPSADEEERDAHSMTRPQAPRGGAPTRWMRRMRIARGNLSRLLLLVLLGLAGALLFGAAGIPAAAISGSMVAVGLAVLFGKVDARVPQPLVTALYAFMGVSMGGGVTPEVVGQIHLWPVSLLILGFSLFAITGAVYLFLLAMRWARNDAYFAAIPGALTYVLVMVQGARVDAAKVAQSQSVRVFLLIAILPSLVVYVGNGSGIVPDAVPADLFDFVLMFAGGAAGAFLAMRIGVPGGALVGAFVGSALLHVFGIIEGRPPQLMIDAGFLCLGVLIGLRFYGTTPRQIAANLVASLGAFCVGLSIAAGLALLTARLLDMPFGQTLIAFAPGGLEAMVMLAFLMELDPAYVAVHQLGRFFLMVLLVPIVARLLLGPGWRRT